MNALSKPISSTAVTVSQEVLLRLAGETDDQVGREGQVRDGGAHLVHEPQEPLAAVSATHRLQDSRRAGLERQVRVLADRVALGHCGDHRRPEILRMRAREADPPDSVHGVAGAEQLAEVRPDVRQEVAAVRVDVLAEQRDLSDAGPREALDLGDDLAGTAALLPAREPMGRCSRRTWSCSPSRPGPSPGSGAPGASAAGSRTSAPPDRTGRVRRPRRRRRATRPRCGIEPGPNATST